MPKNCQYSLPVFIASIFIVLILGVVPKSDVTSESPWFIIDPASTYRFLKGLFSTDFPPSLSVLAEFLVVPPLTVTLISSALSFLVLLIQLKSLK